VATASEIRGQEVETESELAFDLGEEGLRWKRDSDCGSNTGDITKCIDVYIAFVGIPVGIFSLQGIGFLAKCTKEP
jgi:hypothetical protein